METEKFTSVRIWLKEGYIQGGMTTDLWERFMRNFENAEPGDTMYFRDLDNPSKCITCLMSEVERIEVLD